MDRFLSFFSTIKLHKRTILFVAFIIVIPAILFLLTFRAVEEQKKTKAQAVPSPTQSPQWKPYDQQVKQGDIQQTNKILEVFIRYNPNTSPQFVITGMTKMNGYVTKPINTNNQFKIQLLDTDKTVLAEQPFSIQQQQRVEAYGYDGQIEEQPVTDSHQDFPINMHWLENGSSVRVINEQGIELAAADLSLAAERNNKPTFKSINGAELISPQPQEKANPLLNFLQSFIVHAQNPGDKVDIVFVSFQYSDYSVFQNDVSTMSRGFLEPEPFKSRASQFAFHTVETAEDLNCSEKASPANNSSILVCDAAKVRQIVNQAGAPNDVIAVVINERACGGRSLRATGGDIMVLTNRPDAAKVMAHEFGHTVGRLLDEYISDRNVTTDGPLDNTVRSLDPNSADGNCYAGNPPVAAWPEVQEAQYTKGCTHPNWYAPSKDSLMRNTYSQSCFNPISQAALNRRLDQIVGKFSGTIVVDSCQGDVRAAPAKESTAANIRPTYVCAGSSAGDFCPAPEDEASREGSLNPGIVQGNGCTAGQLYCNGNVISGGADNALYRCQGPGIEPLLQEQCSTTCKVAGQGANDSCQVSQRGNDSSAGQCTLLRSGTGKGYVGQCKPGDIEKGYSYCYGDGPNSLKCLPPGEACNAPKLPYETGANKGSFCIDPLRQSYTPPAGGSDRGICTVCPAGAEVKNPPDPENPDINKATTCGCPDGQVVINNVCRTPIANCAENGYNEAGACATCMAGYILQNNACVMPPPPPPNLGGQNGGGQPGGGNTQPTKLRNGATCRTNTQCTSGYCSGTCKNRPAVPNTAKLNGASCTTHTQCRSGYCRDNSSGSGGLNGVCATKPAATLKINGASCTSHNQCQSGFCRDTASGPGGLGGRCSAR